MYIVYTHIHIITKKKTCVYIYIYYYCLHNDHTCIYTSSCISNVTTYVTATRFQGTVGPPGPQAAYRPHIVAASRNMSQPPKTGFGYDWIPR